MTTAHTLSGATAEFYAPHAVYLDPDTGDTACGPARISVRDGLITALTPGEVTKQQLPSGTVVFDKDEVVLPGLVDTHVHVNEPGRTQWEGFVSATRSAAAGGVTTLIDMPLNSVPTTISMDALAVKQEVATGKTFVNVGFWGGAVPSNVGTGELRRLWEQGHVFGFKCFLADSAIEEFAPLSPAQLREAMTEIAGFGGLLIVHAESEEHFHDVAIDNTFSSFLASRPNASERHAIELVIDTARETGCRTHILHLSDASSIELLAAAQQEGVPITAETCPHYLSLFAEEIYNGRTATKCCPPIRDASNREQLWAGLKDGVISMVVSDHSPCTPELKRLKDAPHGSDFKARMVQGLDVGGPLTGGSFDEAWGGISSVQLGLSVVWSEARKRGLSLAETIEWMSAKPAEFAGLHDRGRIAVGLRADFVAVAPDSAFVVLPDMLHHKNKLTAYEDHALAGLVRSTWISGDCVYERGRDNKERFSGRIFPFTLRP